MALPTDDADLETNYSAQDVLDVGTNDTIRVSQSATEQYAIHQFKDYTENNSALLTWDGQTNVPCNESTVYLQIYHRSTGWETVDSDSLSGADTDFELQAEISDLTNYKDGSGIICCRIYQQAL